MNTERERGQSIIVVTLMMVALVVLAALAVDMTGTYFTRRTAQAAADAAALAGGEELAWQRNDLGSKFEVQSNAWPVKAAMNVFAEANDVEDTHPGSDGLNYNVVGWYLDSFGNRLSETPFPAGDDPTKKEKMPEGVFGIEAMAIMTAPTFLGGVLGYDGYDVSALAAVSIVEPVCGVTCVVPIATYWCEEGGECIGETRTFTESRDPDWTLGPWGVGNWPPKDQDGDDMYDFTCFNIWNGEGPGNFGWLNWTEQGYYCDTDDCSSVCLGDNLDPANCIGWVSIGDLVAGATGTMNDSKVRQMLDYYIGDPTRLGDTTCDYFDCYPESFVVPLWSTKNDGQGCGEDAGVKYTVSGFAVMQLLGYKTPQGNSWDPWFIDGDGDDEPDIHLCHNVGDPPGEPPNDGNRLTAYFKRLVLEDAFPGDCDASYGTLTTIRIRR